MLLNGGFELRDDSEVVCADDVALNEDEEKLDVVDETIEEELAKAGIETFPIAIASISGSRYDTMTRKRHWRQIWEFIITLSYKFKYH